MELRAERARTCAWCQAAFLKRNSNQRYCNPTCYRRHKLARAVAKLPYRECPACHKSFRPKTIKSSSGKFCSRGCGKTYRSKVKAVRHLVRILKRLKACRTCGQKTRRYHCSVICWKRYKQIRDKALRRAPAITKPCTDCQEPITIRGAPGPAFVKRCTPCQRKFENRRNSSWDVRDRMKPGAIYQQVDPEKVLERDRWKCKTCGRRTPKRLRGTTDPRAPEVDHIIPVGLGGDNTYENVQCCCRECNMRKRDKALGQILLFGMIETRSKRRTLNDCKSYRGEGKNKIANPEKTGLAPPPERMQIRLGGPK